MTGKVVEATFVVRFDDVLAEGEFIAATTATFAGEPVILGCRGPMEEPPRFRYRIHQREGAHWVQAELADFGPLGAQFVGRLGRNRWIVAAGHRERSRETAIVFDEDGRIVRSFDPGRDLSCMETTEDGQVWIGYGEDPHGALDDYGLVALDEEGVLRFGFNSLADQEGVPWIFCSYALTATGPDEVWACYYTDFPLVRIHRHELADVWAEQPVSGAHAIAVGTEQVLFAGAWDHSDESRDSELPGTDRSAKSLFEPAKHVFRLLDLDTLQTEDLRIVDQAGHEFDPRAHPAEGLSMFARGSQLFLRRLDDLLVVDVANL